MGLKGESSPFSNGGGLDDWGGSSPPPSDVQIHESLLDEGVSLLTDQFGENGDACHSMV